MYTVSVVALNGAKGASAPVTTTHVRDSTVPVAGAVLDGPTAGVDIDFQTAARVSVTWDAFTAHTAVDYTLDVCEAVAVPEKCVFSTPVGTATHFSGQGLPLESGVSYFARVVGAGESGLTAEAVSDGTLRTAMWMHSTQCIHHTSTCPCSLIGWEARAGFLIDATDPVPGVVRDGIADADVTIQGSWNFAASWDAWVDPESPIVQYQWCLGSDVGKEDVMACTLIVRGVVPP